VNNYLGKNYISKYASHQEFPIYIGSIIYRLSIPCLKCLGLQVFGVLEFRVFKTLEYFHTHIENIGMGPKSRQKIYFYFTCALYSWPEDNFLQYFNMPEF
jgi:hypothetical protein